MFGDAYYPVIGRSANLAGMTRTIGRRVARPDGFWPVNDANWTHLGRGTTQPEVIARIPGAVVFRNARD